MANYLVPIEALAEDGITILSQALTFTALANKKVDINTTMGQRGGYIQRELPVQFRTTNSLVPSVPDFNIRVAVFPINQESNTSYQVTSEELATYTSIEKDPKYGRSQNQQNLKSMMTEIAASIDSYVGAQACLNGYRWYGDLNPTSSSSILTWQGLTTALSYFRSFSDPMRKASCVLPLLASTSILNTINQQFTPVTNDKIMSKAWQLPALSPDLNTEFFRSNLCPIHTSGTAATGTEITITSVSNTTYTLPGQSVAQPASNITVSGLTPGDTIVVQDIGDIGTASTSSTTFNSVNPLKFLTLNGHTITDVNAQFNVVVGATADGSGNATFTVYPQLIYDSTGVNPAQNLNRAIVPGTDTLRLVASHRAGTIFFDDYLMFTAPRLPIFSNSYPCESLYDPDLEMSIRFYHGTPIGPNQAPNEIFVIDTLYGCYQIPEGAMRIVLPLDYGQYGT